MGPAASEWKMANTRVGAWVDGTYGARTIFLAMQGSQGSPWIASSYDRERSIPSTASRVRRGKSIRATEKRWCQMRALAGALDMPVDVPTTASVTDPLAAAASPVPSAVVSRS